MNENGEVPVWVETCVALLVLVVIVLFDYLEQECRTAETDWKELAW